MLRKIGILVVTIVVLLIVYNLLSQIFEALKSGERLTQEIESLYKLEAKNKELKKRLSEIKSPRFLEEQARNKLNLGKRGETVVIIPEEKIRQVLGDHQAAQEARLPNWLGWWKIFFR